MLKEFREFISRGNVVDLAVGVIIGAAFTAIVTSLVNDIIMPPIGLLLSGVDFSQIVITLQQGTAEQEAVTINIGNFINALIVFLITALAVFFLVRAINRMQREPEEPAEEAPAEPTTEEKLVEALNRLNANLEKQNG